MNEKLHNYLRLRIACEFENDLWLLDDMLGILKKEVESKERSILIGTSFDEKPFDKNEHCEFDYSIAALFSSENRTDKKPCVFCELLNHKSIIMHLHVHVTISVNTVVINTILQFVFLIRINYLDLTINLQII